MRSRPTWGTTVLAFAFLATSMKSMAQIGPGQVVESAFRYFKDIHLFPYPPVPDENPFPLAGSSFAKPAPTTGEVDFLAGEKNQRLRIISAGRTVQSKGDILTASGGVKAIYQGYTMTCDSLQANRATEVFILKDHAQLEGVGGTVKAQEIIVDYRNRTYQAFASAADMKPTIVGGQIRDDVYAKGKESSGSRRESFITFGDLTTCDKAHPDYDIHAKSIDVRFGKRIVMRQVSVDLLGHRLFNLPFLSLPLDDRTYQNLPYAGQDPVEGYFVKTHYGIPLKGEGTLVTREDFMTRLGLGLGAQYLYQNLKGKHQFAGDIGVYGVTGARSYDINFDHAMTIGGGKLQMNTSYQANDYLTAPQSKILNSRITYDITNRYGRTGLNFRYSKNGSTGFDSVMQNLGLTNTESIGQKYQFNTTVNFADSASSYGSGTSASSIDNRSVSINYNADDDMKQATASLGYQRTIPIGSIKNFYVGTQQTPVFTLKSDSRRLFGQGFGKDFPFNVQASIGQFGDPISGSAITRDFFSFDATKQLGDAKGVNSLNLQSNFKQGLYSDDTAQYTLGFGAHYTHRLGTDTAFNFDYSYLRPEGFSPLGMDASGKLNLASANLTVRPLSKLLLGVQTGYDATQLEQKNTPWQVVSLRAEYGSQKVFLARTLATYDPFVGSWANVRFDMMYRPGATFVGVGIRYDAINHKWADVNGFVQALKWGKAKIDLLAAFNGYSGRLQSEQLNMTYDLHCAEAVLQLVNNQSGFQNGLQLAFFIRLKALPFGSIFGAGTRGQPIGIGTGIGY